MRLAQMIRKTCRKPQFQVPLFSALIAATGVSIAEAANSTSQDATQNTKNNPSFSQVDTNQDNKLVWTEIYAIYDDELNDSEWNESAVYRTYDRDRDSALNDEEYTLFITGLSTAANAQQNAQANNSQQSERERRQAATQAQRQQENDQSSAMADSKEKGGSDGWSSQENRHASDASKKHTNKDSQASMSEKDAQKNKNMDKNAQASSGSQSQPSSGSAPVSVLTITTITSVPVESLKDMEVINNRGEEIGEVEHVLTEADGTISGLVVGVGGFWDIGDKDVRVDADQLQISGNYIIWDTPLDEEQLDNLPEYKGGDEVSVAY